MAPSDTVKYSTDCKSQDDVVDRSQELGMDNQHEKSFAFLRLSAEIRNAIYKDLISWRIRLHGEPRLLDQPAITRVNRQVRAEALPIYYGGYAVALVETSSSSDWVESAQRIVDAFTGGPHGEPGSSTLRHVPLLQLDFLAQNGVFVDIDMMSDPVKNRREGPGGPYEVVMVGSRGMDWTDAAAVRTACNEAATRLDNNIMRRITARLIEMEEGIELVPASSAADQRAALDAMCVFALACPHLTTSVHICDTSRIIDIKPGPFDSMRIEEYMVSIDEVEYS